MAPLIHPQRTSAGDASRKDRRHRRCCRRAEPGRATRAPATSGAVPIAAPLAGRDEIVRVFELVDLAHARAQLASELRKLRQHLLQPGLESPPTALADARSVIEELKRNPPQDLAMLSAGFAEIKRLLVAE